MSKSSVVKLWLGGMVAIAVGLVAAGAAVALMLAYGGTFSPAPSGEGYDFVPRTDAFFWSMVTAIVAGGALATVGALVGLVAWVAALINSFQLPDKTWFTVTLVLGLVGFVMMPFGLIAMLLYVIGAPDGYEAKRPQTPSTMVPQAI
jgi:hypothetical protein